MKTFLEQYNNLTLSFIKKDFARWPEGGPRDSGDSTRDSKRDQVTNETKGELEEFNNNMQLEYLPGVNVQNGDNPDAYDRDIAAVGRWRDNLGVKYLVSTEHWDYDFLTVGHIHDMYRRKHIDVNMSSENGFRHLLKTYSAADLANGVRDENRRGYNFKKRKRFLTDKGYKFQRAEGWGRQTDELSDLYWLAKKTELDQATVNMCPNDEDKFAMLFDSNSDMKITEGQNSSYSELEMMNQTFRNSTWGWAEALIRNLNLWTLDSFKAEVGENYFLAKERFQNALKKAHEKWTKFFQLVEAAPPEATATRGKWEEYDTYTLKTLPTLRDSADNTERYLRSSEYLEGTDWNGEHGWVSVADIYKKVENYGEDKVNMDGFRDLLRRYGAGELANRLWDTIYYTNSEWELEREKLGYSEKRRFLREAWYNFRLANENHETHCLFWLAKRAELDQVSVNQASNDWYRFAMLFDAEWDMRVNTERKFYYSEMQMLNQLFESRTSDRAKTLIENLWLWTLESFTNEMKTNFFLAKEKFRRALTVATELWINFSELIETNWRQEALTGIYEGKERLISEIWTRTDNFINTRLTEEARNQVDIDGLKLKFTSALFNSNFWWATTFDTSHLDKFFDNLTIWMLHGKPYVGFSENLRTWTLEERSDVDVSVGLVNLVIPLLSVSITENNPSVKYEAGQFFQTHRVTDLNRQAHLTVSPVWTIVWFNISISNDTTVDWINEMVDNMGGLLKDAGQDIKDWKSFEDSCFYGKSENKDADAIIYSEMKDFYDTYSIGLNDERKEAFLRDMMAWYLSHYRNQLYNQAEGTKISSFWFWVFLLAGFLPLPYFRFWAENISNEWSEILRSLDRQRRTTYETRSANSFGIEQVERNWKQVLRFPGLANYNISASPLPGSNHTYRYVAAEVEGNDLFIGWYIDSISIDEHFTNEQVYRTIVIWDWVKDENGLYLNNERMPIMSDLDMPDRSSISSASTIQTAMENPLIDNEAIHETRGITDDLFNIIQEDALMHPKTDRMLELQRMIFDYKTTWKTTLEDTWNKFMYVVEHDWFREYAVEKGNGGRLNRVLRALGSKTDNEKVLILQAMNSNFMKKTNLSNIDNDSAIEVRREENGNLVISSIKAYDTRYKRNELFDRVFEEKFSGLDIKAARDAWYNANESETATETEYTLRPVTDSSIAFAWVMWPLVESANGIKNPNIQWVMPYTWSYNVAVTTEGWLENAFIDIEWKSEHVINAIPAIALENIRSALEDQGVNLPNINAVKDFINQWWSESIKVDYQLAFCRLWECLNDAVVLKNLTIVKTSSDNEETNLFVGVTQTWSVNVSHWNVTKFEFWRAGSLTDGKRTWKQDSEGWVDEADEGGWGEGWDNDWWRN